EIIGHHILRCAEILEILTDGPKTAREIAMEHFSAASLKGAGMFMAENEILSHCELLAVAGDIRLAEGETFMAAGSENIDSTIQSLVPD
ncbi:MAG: hypothetical protein ACWGSD_13650, partial [Thermodesulfobacteriota bacterium]